MTLQVVSDDSASSIITSRIEASMVRKSSRLMYYTILRSLKANPNQTDVVTEYLG